jgi:hypothetical protein
MKQSSRTVAVYLLLTFSSGLAVGAFGHWLYNSRTVRAETGSSRVEDFRKRYVSEMESRLKLTAEQKAKLIGILDQTRTLYRELNEKHKPEYQAIQEHQRDQVRSMLSEAQQAEYEKLAKEREAQRTHRPF